MTTLTQSELFDLASADIYPETPEEPPELHDRIDELAAEVEVSIREFGERIEDIPDYPDRDSHRQIVSVDDIIRQRPSENEQL